MSINRRNLNKIAIAGLTMHTLSPISTFAGQNSARDNGFHMPEESHPHLRTFMQWPVSPSVHPDRYFLEALQKTIADIANAISEFEPVVMLMDRVYEKNARQQLGSSVEIWDISTEDLWCRDSGPVFVKNASGELAVSSVNFNGWGGKQIHYRDGEIAEKIAERLELPFFNNDIVGEAGGVESDGDGTLIAHESSWINLNRNNGAKAQIEEQLLGAFGARKVIWAPGIKGQDITDYHIDALARFSKPGQIVIQLPQNIDPYDPWSKAAYETYDILKSASDAKGREFEIVQIREPENVRMKSPEFVASYVNYYLCNGGVISAKFGDKRADRQAKEVLAMLYPDREIIALNVDPVGEVGGGIHCATQQQPA